MSLLTRHKVMETIEKVNQKLLLPKNVVDAIEIRFVKNKGYYGRAEVDRYRSFGENVKIEYRIKLSEPLLSCFGEDRHEITIAHELCHIADVVFNGRMSSHDISWQNLMIRAGYAPDAKGPMLPANVPGMVTANCACRVHTITTNRATRIKKGAAYRCGYCKKELELING